jgi:hypothetical protein
MWRHISTCTHRELDFEQISHIGLRTDGEFALIFSCGDEGIVWDVCESRVRRFLPKEKQLFDKFIAREGFLNLN